MINIEDMIDGEYYKMVMNMSNEEFNKMYDDMSYEERKKLLLEPSYLNIVSKLTPYSRLMFFYSSFIDNCCNIEIKINENKFIFNNINWKSIKVSGQEYDSIFLEIFKDDNIDLKIYIENFSIEDCFVKFNNNSKIHYINDLDFDYYKINSILANAKELVIFDMHGNSYTFRRFWNMT